MVQVHFPECHVTYRLRHTHKCDVFWWGLPSESRVNETSVSSCHPCRQLCRRYSNSIPYPPHFCMTILPSSCRPSPTSLTGLFLLTLYHVVWRLQLLNPCWKSYHLTRIFWKTTAPSLTSHFCLKSLKKSFFTNISPIFKQTTSATPFTQPIVQVTAPKPSFCVS